MASSSSNEFGWKMLSLLTQDQGQNNLFISPFSISVALAMTRLGARGETALAMEKALCWQKEANAIHQEFRHYMALLQSPNNHCTLRTANRIFIEEGYPILKDFLNQTKELYFAESVPAQFKKNAEAVRFNINTWVEEQTEKNIKDLIQPGVLNKDSRMVLVNAIYFKGEWVHKFEANDTYPRPFYTSLSHETSVPMMHMSMSLPYYEGNGYTAVEFPYKGQQNSMVIFLPNDKFGLQALEQRLSMTKIKETFPKLKSEVDCQVHVALPKFKISCSMSMKDTLSQLGMATAFTPDADFNGMTDAEDLCISEVIHKAFLKVDEEGTEAAAATAVVMMFGCAMPPKMVVFEVDHPFLVIIRDKPNDMILFMGQVTDPSA